LNFSNCWISSSKSRNFFCTTKWDSEYKLIYLADEMREPRARQIVVDDGVRRRSRCYVHRWRWWCVRDDASKKVLACEAKEESEEEAILYHTICHVRLHRYLLGLSSICFWFLFVHCKYRDFVATDFPFLAN
jgi:hypothetical protein